MNTHNTGNAMPSELSSNSPNDADENMEQLPDGLIAREEYELTAEQMNELETDLWNELGSKNTEEHDGIVIAAVAWNSRYAAFGRTSEREHYETDDYDLHKGMIPYEDRSLFLYTIDADSGTISHVKRLVFANTPEEITATGLTGLEIVDDRITSEGEEHADLEEITNYHNIENISQCLNVASNHKMFRQGMDRSKQYTLASYKAVFEVTRQHNLHAVFAYLNTNAVKSFSRFGLQYDMLAGKEFHVPNNAHNPNDPASEPFEKDYVAVFIPESPENIELFKGLGELIPATNAPMIAIE